MLVSLPVYRASWGVKAGLASQFSPARGSSSHPFPDLGGVNVCSPNYTTSAANRHVTNTFFHYITLEQIIPSPVSGCKRMW